MSSGFVPAGASSSSQEPAHKQQQKQQQRQSDAEWDLAHSEIEAQQLRKQQEANPNAGKSLYEVLQANKAAKQEAFEEASKLKNQFRALDDDEVDFLDSVLATTRAKEQAVQKETSDQLELFRRQREQAERTGTPVEPSSQGEQWTGRKRKKNSERTALKGVKFRKSSSSQDDRDAIATIQQRTWQPAVERAQSSPKTADKLVGDAVTATDDKSAARLSTDASTSSVLATASNVTKELASDMQKPDKPAAGLGLAAYSDSDQD